MLKANVNKEFTEIEIVGNVKDICTDLARILAAINDKLTQQDASLGHIFRVMFAKGFMDGICFGKDRKHMEAYLAEAEDDDVKPVSDSKDAEVSSILDDLIGFLNGKLEGLNGEEENDALK